MRGRGGWETILEALLGFQGRLSTLEERGRAAIAGSEETLADLQQRMTAVELRLRFLITAVLGGGGIIAQLYVPELRPVMSAAIAVFGGPK